MDALSKSPIQVGLEALAIGQRCLRPYAHKFSPHTYTQPQLFACLVLKTFFRTDYRGISELLCDFTDLQDALELKFVPHFTTLQKASTRLLLVPKARHLFQRTVRRFLKRRQRVQRVAFDSTGLGLGRRSLYYVRRRQKLDLPWQTVAYGRFAKLEAAVDCDSHLFLAVLVGRGPAVDVNRFVPLLQATMANCAPQSVLADAGYDSEANHRYAHQQGISSFIPAKIGRPSDKLPTGRHRRRMRQRLTKDYGHYGQRWQAESGFSMLKGRLNSMVNARTYWNQCRELLLLALTYNIMILYAAAGFLQSKLRPLFISELPSVCRASALAI
jgi:Transposase DDE domain